MIRLAAFVLMLVASAQASTGLPEDKALVDAAFGLDLQGVRAALAKGADPNVRKFETSPRGATLTPVLLSAIFGRPQETQQASGASQSAEQTRTAIAKALFDAGATLTKLDDISRSILWTTSIRMGNVGLIQLLIDHGVSVTKKVFPEDVTPTELALMEGQQTAYEFLVSRGGSPVDDARSEQFALLASTERSDVAGMEQSIKGGAHINNVIDDQTALMVAVSEHIYTKTQLSAIRWLLDHGADPNVGSRFDLPLHRFVFSSSFTLNNLSKLSEKDLNAIRPAGREFDAQRMQALNQETLICLLKGGAKMSTVNNYGWTALHYAARFDNVMAAEILIMEGARISQRDPIGKTPLDYAVSGTMIKLLTSSGAGEQLHR